MGWGRVSLGISLWGWGQVCSSDPFACVMSVLSVMMILALLAILVVMILSLLRLMSVGELLSEAREASRPDPRAPGRHGNGDARKGES